MANWPDTARIYRKAAGSHDGSDVFSAGPDTEVYNDSADIQPLGTGSSDGEHLERDDQGKPVQDHDLKVFLKHETKLKDVKLEDLVTLTYENGETESATVTGTRRLDGIVFVRWAD